MFTGIIQGLGQIVAVHPLQADTQLQIESPEIDWSHSKLGDSVAINGACMTITALTQTGFMTQVSAHSLSIVRGLDHTGPVNLELALRVGDALGGHYVSGHVDGTGVIVDLTPVAESWRLAVAIPKALAPFMARKGSVALHGVSLTINEVYDGRLQWPVADQLQCASHVADDACLIVLNLVEHTIAHTLFQFQRSGDRLNVEIDTLARYVERMLAVARGS